MNDAEIKAILARAEKATPGPWSRVMALGSRWWTLGVIRDHTARPLTDDADWDFAEHSREDIPALCRDLLAAREALSRIAHRCDELETRDHDAIDYAEIIGLREMAQAALAAGNIGTEKP